MTKQTITSIAREVSESKVFKITLYTLGGLVVVCFIFQAGMIVGFHRASYGRDWGNNYYKNFGSKGARIMSILPEAFPNAHGALGTIIKKEPPTFIVEDRDNTEKVILVTDKTQIRKRKDVVNQDDLSIDSSVVVIGSPNQEGQIEARLIRILPSPMSPFTIEIPDRVETR